VRTLAVGAARDKPMAYNSGTVWPQDHTFIAQGSSQVRLPNLAVRGRPGRYSCC
jgi:glycogen debranching enzyme